MSLTSIGDLAHSLMLRSRTNDTKRTIGILTTELSSGKTSNPAERLAGDYAQIADIDRALNRLGGFSVATAEAKLFANAAQTALSRIGSLSAGLSETLLTVASYEQETVRSLSSAQARGDLAAMMAALNTSAGGRSLFAGIRTDSPAVASDQVLMSELQAVVSGLTNAADVVTAVDNWFASPSGYDAMIYTGATESLAPLRISDTDFADMSLRADEDVFKSVLRDTALAALATDAAHGLGGAEQSALLVIAGKRLTDGAAGIIETRAGLGSAQARIQNAQANNAAAATSFEIARTELLNADPYDTAARLQAAQFQLESLYAVTVRTSQLSLVNYLK